MAAAFIEIAQSCAPVIEVQTLAGVISLESGFQPFAIRTNSGKPLAAQPTSKAEAIELATSLVADHQDVQIGLGAISVEELRKLKLSISEAFEPCLNLRATATLLDGYYRLALRGGATAAQAETVMLQSYYGRNDPSLGATVRYDEQVRQEMKKLAPKLDALVLAEPHEQARSIDRSHSHVARPLTKPLSPATEAASWDVYGSRRRSSVLVFNNNQPEQSE
ncbi:type IV secretion system protein VirB1 [Phyllobacterium sp. SB3]|uniref:type IV secretion system protein VirB1 n=1 Tax=Phyllobacterium sp. SB3 TaxID=3156073 RepID=UPI0032AF23D2